MTLEHDKQIITRGVLNDSIKNMQIFIVFILCMMQPPYKLYVYGILCNHKNLTIFMEDSSYSKVLFD